MAIPRSPLEGDALLVAVTDAMVALHERYYHRPPGMARTRMMGDDLLACVLGGVYTDVEKTLIELERAPMVADNRNAFQAAMEDRFIAAVEGLSGRRVAQFISSHNVGPDLEIELFFLAAPQRHEASGAATGAACGALGGSPPAGGGPIRRRSDCDE